MPEKTLPNLRSHLLKLAVVISVLFSFWQMFRMTTGIREFVQAVEILTLIPVPLAVFYMRSNWPQKERITNYAVLILLWFFTYSLFHELSHVAGSLLAGRRITEYQLTPRYWKGEFFSGARVASVPSGQPGVIPGFLAGLAPYIKDILFLLIGYMILKTKNIFSSFLCGLIFIICCLSSLFDIVSNYSIYVIDSDTAGNDFKGTAMTVGAVWTNIIGTLFASFSIIVTYRVLKLYRDFPKKQEI